jgi:hypothetical protein
MDADVLQRRRRALANPVYFHLRYIAPFDPNWPKEDLGDGTVVPDPMPAFAEDMLRWVLLHVRSLVRLPPEFLKTTLLSQSLPLWLTYRSVLMNTQLRGLLMSEEEGMARANLTVVKWHIEENPELLRDFSDERGHPLVRPSASEVNWKDDSITVERDHPSRDPTWQAKGLDSKGVHGRRLDWFIGDDLVTPRNADSPAMQKRAIKLFDDQVRSRLVKGSHACVAGNFLGSRDLLAQLEKRPRWQMYARPSLGMPGQPAVAPKESQIRMARPLWPENWDMERLLDEYAEAPNSFKRLHLFDEKAEQGELLQVDWVTRRPEADAPLELAKFFMSIDPAPGGDSDDLDFFNISVGALVASHLWLVRSLDVRCRLPRQVALATQMHDAFNRVGAGVLAIGVSKQHLDSYFQQALTLYNPALLPKVVPISAPGHKELRLEGLGPVAHSGWLVVCDEVWTALTSDADDQVDELSLESQWREFPYANHDDKLDGLDLLVRTTAEFSGIAGDATYRLAVTDAI